MTVSGVFPRFVSFIGADTLWHSSRDLKLLIILRMVRLLGYGGTTLILALYLHALGFKDSEIGLFMTSTLVGDLFISFGLTYVGDGMSVRATVLLGALLMCASGIAFAFVTNFWVLLLASIIGVINPSANEIDPFKAIEESAISRLSTHETCSDIFAWWSMLGMIGTAVSNMLTGFLVDFLRDTGYDHVDALKAVFLTYALVGFIKLLLCLLLSSDVELKLPHKIANSRSLPGQHKNRDGSQEREPLLQNCVDEYQPTNSTYCGEESSEDVETTPSMTSRRIFTPESFAFLWKLSLAMSFDFVGSGLAQISWMIYFFKREYDMPEAALGSATFAAGIISSILNLVASPLSRAIGQVQTMVLCHTINSASLIMVSVPSNKHLALVIFIFRIVTREIDNAPRQAFISAGVLHEERTSAMGVINMVKIVGSCIGLYITGLFANLDCFWLAFIVAGCLKLLYNILITTFFWRSYGSEKRGATPQGTHDDISSGVDNALGTA
ncbi:major facilitator superfamily domain-containing protein [Daldinia vernicosa]|uniref:major facilitator superfamily domain-containing protein n=1 Tax=Daldinia vernicosa TaxID=114800 RepID=UPI0020072DDF|nr:major facilitator superfamily domain-containing protein [Daldinia vernicosa]KAI0848440.1 major facilitator superfamily domain-containing protein [Daldinia vernicosa]